MIDSVVPSASGINPTKELMNEMKNYWFWKDG